MQVTSVKKGRAQEEKRHTARRKKNKSHARRQTHTHIYTHMRQLALGLGLFGLLGWFRERLWVCCLLEDVAHSCAAK